MIVIAVLTVLAGIAIPTYNNYIRESQLSTARMNVEPLRLALEDYWLDNSTYATINGQSWTPGGTKTLETGPLGWRPDGDNDQYSYAVTAGTNTFTITVTHIASSRSATCTKNTACTYAE